MNIVYFGFNALSSCLDLLIHHPECQVVKVYTGEEGEHTDQIVQLAQQNEIQWSTLKPLKKEMHMLVEQGADCFICAEYPHKISIPNDLAYSVNIHPTMLPEGRGQTPLPHLILSYPQHAGITLHKMTDVLDHGDIILSQALLVNEHESFDSLHSKIFLEAPMLLQQLLSNWDALYLNSKAQEKGSYWPTIDDQEQAIDWNMTNKQIDLKSRAFASLGIKFNLNQTKYYYTSVQCVNFKHAYQAGDVISFDAFKLTIATLEGFLIIPRSCLYEL